MKTRFTQALAACAVVLGALAAGPLSAEAGTGLRYQQWATSGYTVSMSSYRYSNMTGFVQAIINSDPNVPCIAIDGNFGSVTTWYTAIAQNDLLGYNNGGVVDTAIWNGFFSTQARSMGHDS